MKRLTDPSFQYVPSFATDLKKKFRAMAKAKKEAEKPTLPEPTANVQPIKRRTA